MRPWMPMYIGDYLRDTSRLTTTEHGAYLLLIFDYWSSGKPLPDDDRQLATITKMSQKGWRDVRKKIAPYFSARDGLLFHKRIEEELVSAAKIRDERRKAGANGNAKQAQLRTELPPQASGRNCGRQSPSQRKNQDSNQPFLTAAREEEEGLKKNGGGDPSGRFAPLKGSLAETKRDLLISKVTRFAAAKIADPEVAIAGLMGDDPEHDGQWWLDHLDKLMKAQHWDDTERLSA
jgi:uncharacterized protein YdaU (DUF1376 family)